MYCVAGSVPSPHVHSVFTELLRKMLSLTPFMVEEAEAWRGSESRFQMRSSDFCS